MFEGPLEVIRTLSTTHPLKTIALFVLIRASAIVIPPIFGLPIDLAGLAVFGWWRGFLYAELGIMLGAMTAFYLGRTAGRVALRGHSTMSARWIAKTLGSLHTWENRLGPSVKFWGFVGLRFITNPAFDVISYAAGISKMKAWSFAAGTLLGNAPSVFLVFYFGGLMPDYAVTFSLFAIGVVILLLAGYRSWCRKESGQ